MSFFWLHLPFETLSDAYFNLFGHWFSIFYTFIAIGFHFSKETDFIFLKRILSPSCKTPDVPNAKPLRVSEMLHPFMGSRLQVRLSEPSPKMDLLCRAHKMRLDSIHNYAVHNENERRGPIPQSYRNTMQDVTFYQHAYRRNTSFFRKIALLLTGSKRNGLYPDPDTVAHRSQLPPVITFCRCIG